MGPFPAGIRLTVRVDLSSIFKYRPELLTVIGNKLAFYSLALYNFMKFGLNFIIFDLSRSV